MKLIWHGHACYTLESSQGTVVFDPFEPEYVPGIPTPELAADLVLCSHFHNDHGCAQAVRQTKRAPAVKVETLECFHDEALGAKRGSNLIHIVEAEGKRIVHMGDLGHLLAGEQLERLGKVDVLLIPVGGFYTIDAMQAHTLAEKIGAAVTVPMHYRGEGFGFDVIAPVEDFTCLRGSVEYAGGNVLELDGELGQGRTVVLRCPVK